MTVVGSNSAKRLGRANGHQCLVAAQPTDGSTCTRIAGYGALLCLSVLYSIETPTIKF